MVDSFGPRGIAVLPYVPLRGQSSPVLLFLISEIGVKDPGSRQMFVEGETKNRTGVRSLSFLTFTLHCHLRHEASILSLVQLNN